MKELGIGCLLLTVIGILIVGGLVSSFASGIISFPFHVAGNEIETAHDAIDKTINADNAIYNYEWFKQTYQDIEAQKAQLSNAQQTFDSFVATAGERKDWTFEDKNEHSRLNSVVLGIKNNLEQTIANYNARASMANRNIFENSILPNFIDALTFITK
jgi:hypothetical protein